VKFVADAILDPNLGGGFRLDEGREHIGEEKALHGPSLDRMYNY
jgi:hypothetical protein